MGEVLVSVIVPVYNVEQYLDRCLKSITEQTYKNLQIILVDDGSPDNCPKICDAWAGRDSRIEVIHKQNAGLGMARNSGLEIAKGEYVFFFDSDDYVDKTIVEKCLAKAKENNSDVVVFGHVVVFDNGYTKERKISKEKTLFVGSEVKHTLLPAMFTYSLGFGVSACKMFNLKVLKNSGVRFVSERELASEDAVFSLEVFSKINSVSIVPEGLYYYYQRENSLTHTLVEGKQKKNNAYLKACLEMAEKAGLPETVKHHIMSRYHGFTLGVIMLIKKSDLPKTQKKKQLKEIFTDSVLRSTLIPQAIAHDALLPKLFWWCLKLKCHPLCYLFINLKAGM